MKVVRGDLYIRHLKRLEFLELDVNHAVCNLQRAVDYHKVTAGYLHAELFKDVRRNDDVDNTKLILHGKEDKAFRSSRSLASNDRPSSANGCPIWVVNQSLVPTDFVRSGGFSEHRLEGIWGRGRTMPVRRRDGQQGPQGEGRGLRD